MSEPGSITGRLLVMLTVGTTVLWLVAAAFSGGILRNELDENFDGALRETAYRLLPLAVDSVRDRDVSDGVHEVHRFEHNDDRGLPYQVRALNGEIILRSEDAPAAPFDDNAQAGFSDAAPYRVFTLVDPDTQFAIQVGDSLAHRAEVVLASTLALFAPLLILIPLSILGILYAVRRGLRPLRTLQGEILARDSDNLAPLDVGALPRELAPVAQALSRLIDRLRGAFEAERQFAANSAHELRTPIAGALAQTQRLIETTGDPQAKAEARKIEATLRRLADLAEKLMQLARADAGIAANAEPVAVVPVLNLVVADARARAHPPRTIAVEIAPQAERLAARINVDALGIVFRNLVDNALSHSPPATPVSVAVTANGDITVRNACPTIPPEVLSRLRRRFERGVTPASGSGLGLAIVETILSQVGGSLDLRSPATDAESGFEVIVRLPPVRDGGGA